MPTSDHQVAAQGFSGTVVPSSCDTGLLQCLIVSGDDARREALTWAAVDAGWQALGCSNLETAQKHFNRYVTQMAVIDLQGATAADQSSYTVLIDNLARHSDLLMVVCGHEGEIQEELWARQIGVWMYLPGIEEAADLTPLFGEATFLARRLRRPVERVIVTTKPHHGPVKRIR